ncbi:MAG: 50S ribosomal protein L30e [Candidatus Thalassarchaeaceae archaeon]|jgi:large subunit ribosomal protein L30e|nr:50S ribosomal protein L30e [Candidatus Thalassarchaeaceae archaeon]
MDISRQLKTAASSGNMTFGQNQATDGCGRGDAKLVIFAANCPQNFIDNLRARHPDVPMHRVDLVNRELGAACGKPFSVSAICVLDEGSSELLSLRPNLD